MRQSQSYFALSRRTSTFLVVALAALMAGQTTAWGQDAAIPTVTDGGEIEAGNIYAETTAAPYPSPMTGVYHVYDANKKKLISTLATNDPSLEGASNGQIHIPLGPGSYTLTVEYSGDCTYQSSMSEPFPVHIHATNARAAKASRPSSTKPRRAQPARAASPIVSGMELSTHPRTDGTEILALVYFSQKVNSSDAGQVQFRVDKDSLGSAPVTLVSAGTLGIASKVVDTNWLRNKHKLQAERLATANTTASTSCVKYKAPLRQQKKLR